MDISLANTMRFQVHRDSNIIISTTDIEVVPTYLDPSFDSYEPSFTLEPGDCTNASLSYPTAIINVRQKFAYAGAGAIPIPGQYAALDHAVLYLKSMTCDVNQVCEAVYSSNECILCSSSSLGSFHMNARMELPGQVLTKMVESPLFPLNEPISLSVCTMPIIGEDMSSETEARADFPTTPTVDELTLAVSAKSDLAVIIDSILADDLISGSSWLITSSNKVRMIHEPLSNYYNDIHFCRYETVENGCSSPFYFEQNTSGTIMDTVPDNILNSVWRVPAKGYFQCQDVVKDRQTDRVSFNPSTWFTPMDGLFSFKLTVTSRLSTCAPITDRRTLLSASQIIKTVTWVHLTYSADLRSETSSEKLAIGLGVGIPISILFISGIGFFWLRYR